MLIVWRATLSIPVAAAPRRFPIPPSRLAPCHRSTVRHSRLASSHRAAFGGPLFRPCGLRFAPCPQFGMVVPHRSQAHLRLSLPHWAYSALLRPQGARFVRPSGLQPLRGLRRSRGSLAILLASLGSSYRSALRWPGIPGLRSASRCPRPSTPSGLRRACFAHCARRSSVPQGARFVHPFCQSLRHGLRRATSLYTRPAIKSQEGINPK